MTTDKKQPPQPKPDSELHEATECPGEEIVGDEDQARRHHDQDQRKHPNVDCFSVELQEPMAGRALPHPTGVSTNSADGHAPPTQPKMKARISEPSSSYQHDGATSERDKSLRSDKHDPCRLVPVADVLVDDVPDDTIRLIAESKDVATCRARIRAALMPSPQSNVEPCQHKQWSTGYDHCQCKQCGSFRTDSGWGIASHTWFKSRTEAEFYQKNGRLPDPLPSSLMPGVRS